MKKNILACLITSRCNFRCKHCIREFYETQQDLELYIIEKVINDAKNVGIKHIAVTGGEPIFHPQFNKIIKLICNLGLTWSVVTNGSVYQKYDPTIDDFRGQLKFITLSLDGGVEKTHDFIRQKGSFNQVIDAARHWKEKGIFIRLAYTINSINIREIPSFVELAKELSVDAIRFAAVIQTGNNQGLIISWPQKVTAYNYIKTLHNQKLPFEISNTTSFFSCCEPSRFCGNINEHEPAINPNGEYLFCCDTIGLGAVLGNLQNESFADLYQKGVQTAAWLKAERKRCIENKEFFMGFNSCAFCNELLKDKIRHSA